MPASSFLWVCKPLMAESTFRVVKSLEKPLEIPVHSLEKGKNPWEFQFASWKLENGRIFMIFPGLFWVLWYNQG